MDCKKVCKQLSAYNDKELTQQEAARVDEHLRGCPSCLKELAAFAAGDALLKAAPQVQVSPDFRARFWQKVKEEGAVQRQGIFERFILRWLPVPVLASATIVLFLAFSILSPALYGVADSRTKQDVTSLAANALVAASANNVFGPANFAQFCDHCNAMLCKCCKNCGTGACTMNMNKEGTSK
jgi:anti-sigma factor RsiW